MKLVEVPIGNQVYYARFSLRVMTALEDRSLIRGGSGDSQAELDDILASNRPSGIFWLLAQMLEAGRKAAELDGLNAPPQLSYEELLDRVGLEDFDDMFTLVSKALYADSNPTVETAPAKNGEATPDL